MRQEVKLDYARSRFVIILGDILVISDFKGYKSFLEAINLARESFIAVLTFLKFWAPLGYHVALIQTDLG